MGELTTQKPKNFWDKPEGVTGYILIGGSAFAIFWFWAAIVPFVVAVLANTLIAVALGAVLIGLLIALSDKNFRAGLFYLFKQVCRFFTSWVITIDPIGILKTYIADLEEKREEASKKIDEVNGSREGLDRNIKKNTEDMVRLKSKIDYGRSSGKAENGQIETYLIEFGGLSDMNAKLIPMYNNLTKVQEHLERMYKNSGYLIDQMKIKVRLSEVEYKAIKAANKAMRSAMAIFQGDSSKREMFDESMSYIADDMAAKVGEMKRAIDLSSTYLNNIDLEQGANGSEGAKILEGFDASQFSLLSVADVKKEREAKTSANATYQVGNGTSEAVAVEVGYKAPTNNKYNNF